ncbi:hypothetical protein K435DRAFT_811919 [Dendrothele bispora CBS 962.96]|uniref:JmjC domain-containing protein n=1 Tax=Dendrothele bispora (strain CBS 962.96) TaxID=1314807 RepID=A0A4S8KQZ7_DENBC|nr:hypothetical protein K435DRAFT_811919 [Dendrothele bispora CBS 962.96]
MPEQIDLGRSALLNSLVWRTRIIYAKTWEDRLQGLNDHFKRFGKALEKRLTLEMQGASSWQVTRALATPYDQLQDREAHAVVFLVTGLQILDIYSQVEGIGNPWRPHQFTCWPTKPRQPFDESHPPVGLHHAPGALSDSLRNIYQSIMHDSAIHTLTKMHLNGNYALLHLVFLLQGHADFPTEHQLFNQPGVECQLFWSHRNFIAPMMFLTNLSALSLICTTQICKNPSKPQTLWAINVALGNYWPERLERLHKLFLRLVFKVSVNGETAQGQLEGEQLQTDEKKFFNSNLQQMIQEIDVDDEEDYGRAERSRGEDETGDEDETEDDMERGKKKGKGKRKQKESDDYSSEPQSEENDNLPKHHPSSSLKRKDKKVVHFPKVTVPQASGIKPSKPSHSPSTSNFKPSYRHILTGQPRTINTLDWPDPFGPNLNPEYPPDVIPLPKIVRTRADAKILPLKLKNVYDGLVQVCAPFAIGDGNQYLSRISMVDAKEWSELSPDLKRERHRNFNIVVRSENKEGKKMDKTMLRKISDLDYQYDAQVCDKKQPPTHASLSLRMMWEESLKRDANGVILNMLALPLVKTDLGISDIQSDEYATRNIWSPTMRDKQSHIPHWVTSWTLCALKDAHHPIHVDTQGTDLCSSPKQPGASLQIEKILDLFDGSFAGKNADWDIVPLLVGAGDMIIMQPNTPHVVFTIEDSIVYGLHFYSTPTIQQSCIGICYLGLCLWKERYKQPHKLPSSLQAMEHQGFTYAAQILELVNWHMRDIVEENREVTILQYRQEILGKLVTLLLRGVDIKQFDVLEATLRDHLSPLSWCV